MADGDLARRLIEEALETNRTPEEVCADHPEQLNEVRRRLADMKRVAAQLEAAFPTPAHADEETIVESLAAELPALPGYEVESVLGRGGMGVVYKARHLKLNRTVAVKMLLAGEFAAPREVARFQQESQAMARLRHPNIVQVFDVGEWRGRPFFTMEYVDGGTLAERLSGSPKCPVDAAKLVETLAHAVQAAHDACIVHRDLKPSNILLTTGGEPEISDCGVARQLWKDSSLTLSGARVGTPSYMAPEQARGGDDASCPSVDIYALGAILYETLTGRPPFLGDSASETERQILEEDPIPPTRFCRRIRRDLETICLKCLQKTPARRYTSASTLAADLRRHLNGEPILARPVGLIERTVKWMRRRPALTSAVAVGILSAAAATAVVWNLRSERLAVIRTIEADLNDAAAAKSRSDWTAAASAVSRANARLGDRRWDDLRQRIETAELELAFVGRLDAIRLARIAGSSRFDLAKSDREYAAAFQAAGLGNPVEEDDSPVERLREKSLRTAAASALDDWAMCNSDERRRERLLAAARRADPDPSWGDRVRNPKLWTDVDAILELAKANPVERASVPLQLLLSGLIDSHGRDAVAFLRKTQAAHPNDFWVNFTLGELLDLRCDPEAIGYYRAALALRPSAAAGYVNLAHALNNQGRNAEALELWRQAGRLDPGSGMVLCNLAVAELKRGEFAAAIDLGKRAVDADPTYGESHAVYGEALRRTRRFEDAEASLVKAIELIPAGDSARRNAQMSLKRARDKVSNEDVVNGDERPSDLELARQLVFRNRWSDAAVVYARAFAANPTDDGEAWFEFAGAQLLSGDEEGWRRSCRRMIERCGKTPSLRSYHVARACTLHPDADLARQAESLSAVELDANADAVWALTEKGALHFRTGKFAQAAPLFERSLSAEPRTGKAVLNWLWLSLGCARAGDKVGARNWHAKVDEWIAEMQRSPPERVQTDGLDRHGSIEATILTREAKRLLD
jgi:tetratricopeptide (TPR) repeat protein/tRNA A-37 threonylcarbamoyl transferase component Bud32